MNPSAQPARTTRHVTAFVLAAVFFLIYNANLRDIDAVDTLPITLLPVSILDSHDLTLDEFEQRFAPQPDIWRAGFVFGALQQRDGHIISSYPPGAAVIALPFYAVARGLGVLKDDDWLSYRLTGKLAASAIVALSAAAIFLCLVNITGTVPALLLTLAYGLGTGAFSTASQAMWQHGPGMLCLALALLCLLKIDERAEPSRRLAFAAGLLLAMAVICRSANVIAAGAFTLYLLVHHRRLLPAFLLPASVLAVLFLWHNHSQYGSLSGGYDAILDSQWHGSRDLAQTGMFDHPLLRGLLDTWVSPSKGLLIYSPFVIFALAPLLFSPQQHRRLLPFLALWVVLHSVMLAKNSLWWGGTAFGPRYFLELSAAFVLLIALSYRQLPTLARGGLALLIGLSVLLHTFGAFYAPCGWAETPDFADFHPERHREWRDTEIERCLRHAHASGRIPPTFTLKPMGD